MNGTMIERADEDELRALTTRYAREADRADGRSLAALFVAGGVIEICDDGAPADAPTRVLNGREEIAASVSRLKDLYLATFHFVGQFSVARDEDAARGETLCEAHHLYSSEDGFVDRVLLCRYQDSYAREDARWLFSHRRILVTWEDHRPVHRPNDEPPARFA